MILGWRRGLPDLDIDVRREDPDPGGQAGRGGRPGRDRQAGVAGLGDKTHTPFQYLALATERSLLVRCCRVLSRQYIILHFDT